MKGALLASAGLHAAAVGLVLAASAGAPPLAPRETAVEVHLVPAAPGQGGPGAGPPGAGVAGAASPGPAPGGGTAPPAARSTRRPPAAAPRPAAAPPPAAVATPGPPEVGVAAAPTPAPVPVVAETPPDASGREGAGLEAALGSAGSDEEPAGSLAGVSGHAGADSGGEGSGMGAGPRPGGGGSGPGGGGSGHAAGDGAAARGAGPGADVLAAIHARLAAARRYPYAARSRGVEGTATVRFRIGRGGDVNAVDLVRSAGHRLLDDAALKTVRRAAPFPVEDLTVTAEVVFDLEEAAGRAR